MKPIHRAAAVGALFAVALFALASFYARDVYGSFLRNGALGRIDLAFLLRPMVVDFCVCAAVTLLIWRRAGWTRAVAAGIGVVFALVQYAQFRSAVSSDGYLTAGKLVMAELIHYALPRGAILGLGVTLLAAGVLLPWALSLLEIAELDDRTRERAALVLLAFSTALLLIPRGVRERAMEREHGLVPESPSVALARAFVSLAQSHGRFEARLRPADLELSRAYGIRIDPASLTPLVKPAFYDHPFPWPSAGAIPRPNVIVLFVESLGTPFVGAYGEAAPGLTPNLDDFATHAMRVDGYYNHAFPTVKGLRGQLCSIYPPFGYEEWMRATTKIETSRLYCLPHVLAEAGYHTAYVAPNPADEAFSRSQFIDFGFDETIFEKEARGLFLGGEKPIHPSNLSDHQLFRALTRYLERRDPAPPLFLAVSTIETHFDWGILSDGVPYRDGSDRVLSLYHNLDDAFGTFWRWFEASPYAANTILIVTGDHVPPPSDAIREVEGPLYRGTNVDTMALLIHDPVHALPPTFEANTSSIDFAPSLLQLLAIPNRPNPFVGRSMFTDRAGLKGGPGEGDGDVLIWEGGKPRVVSTKWMDCEAPDLAADPACGVARIVRYIERVEWTNRVWRN